MEDIPMNLQMEDDLIKKIEDKLNHFVNGRLLIKVIIETNIKSTFGAIWDSVLVYPIS
jgi:hypothetical protein